MWTSQLQVIETLRVHADDSPSADLMTPALAGCHQTFSHGACRCHIDHMGKSEETKMAVTFGTEKKVMVLPPCGSMCELVLSGMAMPVYGVQTLISAIGEGEEDGDVEVSDATDAFSYHGNLGEGLRGAYLRSRGVIYMRGASLCDHPRIGSAQYITNLTDAGHSLRVAYMISAAGSRVHWRALGVAGQAAMRARFAHIAANDEAGMRQLARQINPAIR